MAEQTEVVRGEYVEVTFHDGTKCKGMYEGDAGGGAIWLLEEGNKRRTKVKVESMEPVDVSLPAGAGDVV